MRQLVYEHSDGGAQARLPVDRVRRADNQAVGKVVERVAQDDHQRQRRLGYKNRRVFSRRFDAIINHEHCFLGSYVGRRGK